jgi:[ribosomal protein S18]-alanine N-acetyltransferase
VNPSSFVVELASRSDIEAICAIDAACFAQPGVDPAGELARPWARIWVARPSPEAQPVAFLLVWYAADEMHVLTLATMNSFRRQGVGRALLEVGLEEARRRSTRLVLLEVRRSNEAAIQLYRKFGFEKTGVRTRYYADGEDAVEMGLVLDPGTGEREPGRG